jgi:hypothetical protein
VRDEPSGRRTRGPRGGLTARVGDAGLDRLNDLEDDPGPIFEVRSTVVVRARVDSRRQELRQQIAVLSSPSQRDDDFDVVCETYCRVKLDPVGASLVNES